MHSIIDKKGLHFCQSGGGTRETMWIEYNEGREGVVWLTSGGIPSPRNQSRSGGGRIGKLKGKKRKKGRKLFLSWGGGLESILRISGKGKEGALVFRMGEGGEVLRAPAKDRRRSETNDRRGGTSAELSLRKAMMVVGGKERKGWFR